MEPCHHCGQPTLPLRAVRDWDALCTSCGCVAWIAPGEIVRAPVTQLKDFGAFVEIGDGVKALIHVSELSDSGIDHPAEVLRVGDTVVAIVLRLDVSQRKAGLSIKRLPDRQ